VDWRVNIILTPLCEGYVDIRMCIITEFSFGGSCTNIGPQFARATKFCNMASNICGSLNMNSLRVTRLEPTILRWFHRFLEKIFCGPK
jgi:hypothetical protein